MESFIGIMVALAIMLVAIVVTDPSTGVENFKKCVCTGTGPRDSVCQDTGVVENAYENNKLTEYTDLQSRGWSTVSPGQYTYPSAFGCGPALKDDKWFSWDFTEFGST